MIFGPHRNLPACSVTLGGVALPVVTVYTYLGVVLSLPLSWSAHVQPSSWCTSCPMLLGARNFLQDPCPRKSGSCVAKRAVASCWVGLLVRPVWVSWLSLGGQVLQVVCCHCWGACPRCPVVRFLLLSFGLHPTRLKHGSLAHSTCVTFSAHLC